MSWGASPACAEGTIEGYIPSRPFRLHSPSATAKIDAQPSAARRVAVLMPTLDAGPRFDAVLRALADQQPALQRLAIIDSGSSDGTVAKAQAAGLTVCPIAPSTFNHGATRQMAIEQLAGDAAFVVFLTQDAVLANPQAITCLLGAFDDSSVAAAYGRQLPHADATPVAAHARLFNYPPQSATRTLADADRLGLKACFLSNSFAAYRVSALQQVGGFAPGLILGEDMHLAARLMLAGHAVRYQGDAIVYHSHNYSCLQEFQRYFDTGVFHAQQDWLLRDFGGASREGWKFLVSEVGYLLQHAFWRLPEAGVRTVLKLLAYRLGRRHDRLPRAWQRAFSMHKGFWA